LFGLLRPPVPPVVSCLGGEFANRRPSYNRRRAGLRRILEPGPELLQAQVVKGEERRSSTPSPSVSAISQSFQMAIKPFILGLLFGEDIKLLYRRGA
jgi:hypothetical protein